MNNLKEKIKEVRGSIVAIGFVPGPNQITIIGSGFFAEGKIITAAHLLNNLTQDQIDGLKANVMVEAMQNGLEKYNWFEIKLVPEKVDSANDVAIFEFSGQKPENIKDLELADSESVQAGQEAYFIGFPYAAQLINDGFGITLVASRGIVSNIKRDGRDPKHEKVWFIVDAISNPGNSNFPLIDAETNKVIGVMSIAFRTKSQTHSDLDIREPMHIAGAKPINLAKNLLK